MTALDFVLAAILLVSSIVLLVANRHMLRTTSALSKKNKRKTKDFFDKIVAGIVGALLILVSQSLIESLQNLKVNLSQGTGLALITLGQAIISIVFMSLLTLFVALAIFRWGLRQVLK